VGVRFDKARGTDAVTGIDGLFLATGSEVLADLGDLAVYQPYVSPVGRSAGAIYYGAVLDQGVLGLVHDDISG